VNDGSENFVARVSRAKPGTVSLQAQVPDVAAFIVGRAFARPDGSSGLRLPPWGLLRIAAIYPILRKGRDERLVKGGRYGFDHETVHIPGKQP
jgi:hypothetical protein